MYEQIIKDQYTLLSPINKTFEKRIYNRLYSYTEQNKMFSKDQYGFRSGLFTSLTVYGKHENLLHSAKDGLTTCALFCDLSKAFGTIDQLCPTQMAY